MRKERQLLEKEEIKLESPKRKLKGKMLYFDGEGIVSRRNH